MKFYRNILVLVITLALSYYSSIFGGELYRRIFGPSGSFIDFRALSGLPLTYIFFLSLFFTAFGGSKKYWWIGILLTPAVIFEIYFDLEHIYFPMIIGLVGWLLGLAISRTRSKFIK